MEGGRTAVVAVVVLVSALLHWTALLRFALSAVFLFFLLFLLFFSFCPTKRSACAEQREAAEWARCAVELQSPEGAASAKQTVRMRPAAVGSLWADAERSEPLHAQQTFSRLTTKAPRHAMLCSSRRQQAMELKIKLQVFDSRSIICAKFLAFCLSH